MKRLVFCLFFIVPALAASAQDTVLDQDFNVSCAASDSTLPSDWFGYNPISSTSTNGTWQCAPDGGRWGTPGVSCTGVWSSTYHLDTAYLITPQLNLTHYDSLFLEFDSKTTNIVLGGRLSLLADIYDSEFYSSSEPVFDLDSSLSPIFSETDSTGWVTHEVNLTPFIPYGFIYISFMYTSTNTSGNTWYLDNIHTTTFPLHTPNLIKNNLPLTIIGNSTSDQITFSYQTTLPGTYHLAIYDMIGHKTYEEDISASQGKSTYTINGLNLHSGMYLLKMGNGLIYGTTKTIVQ